MFLHKVFFNQLIIKLHPNKERMIEEKQFLGFQLSAQGNQTIPSINPATGGQNEYSFPEATLEELNLAATKAATAFRQYRNKSGEEKANFLTAIADELMNTGDLLIDICISETALPRARIEGERVRTVNQLKMFAALVREGSWVDARLETAIPERTPLPKPDLRYMQKAIGPVAVFGASNFPLAFSVAGGDTSSALAAGCPVVVKAHSAHPATSALVASVINKAAIKTNMPDGVFSLLFGSGTSVGIALVKHPAIKAVGFTGSYTGGKALFDAAANRPDPIPVYAEMGSTNPVFILPEAMKGRGESIATGFAGSVTLGVGQFCTNPGMLVYESSESNFEQQLKTEFEKTAGGFMLTSAICKSFKEGVNRYLSTNGVEQLAVSREVNNDNSNYAQPVLFSTSKEVFLNTIQLSHEVFGPTSLAVKVSSKEEILAIANSLTGHLTATVHGTQDDLIKYKDLLAVLEQKVGRLVINSFPTGVEVCSAMVHGGPFPATTDGRSTSVGTAAIYRFTRPVCYQNMPDQLLPEELQNENKLKILRLVNGNTSSKALTN
jgi:2,5-dioxopentanoate dehydrogenase